jgi:SAM-dependent methyltransferase
MARPTDASNPQSVARFYDWLAGGYDAMTGFSGRFAKESPFYRELVTAHNIHSAIDAGAGTGFHSLLLAQLGVTVTAVDASPRMLGALHEHASTMGLTVSTLVSDLASLPEHVGAPVDAIFSLGNTLAHCLSAEALETVIRGFHAVLRPGGFLVIQMLNYRRILATREELIGTREADGFRFTRRYTFGDPLITFSITREELNGGIPPEVESVSLFPHQDSDVERLVAGAGFRDIRFFGSIAWEPYSGTESRDLIVMAFRG